jgi:hypothetical protein
MIKKLTWLWVGLLSLSGCGGTEGFFLPNPSSLGPQGSASVTTLQVFVVGEPQPLSRLEGVAPGQTISLEARGAPPGSTVSWFSSSVLFGSFLQPGELYLRRAGDFEIRVHAGGERITIPVHVGDGGTTQPPGGDSDPFADEVIAFRPGPFGGFGSGVLPGIVLGAPRGAGSVQGSLHVLSLGLGGEIVLKSEIPVLDGAGEDFIVFENPFLIGGDPDTPFAELGEVAVSQDGNDFVAFTCERDNPAELYPGCAGVSPVFANPENNSIDPTDPDTAGGDAFDLQQVGLPWIQYIRIRDLSKSGTGNSAGFDLDAVAIIYQ